MDLRSTLWHLLAFGALPLWLLAGFADWWCHRRTHIESTSGPTESVWHAVLHLQIAIPVILALYLEFTLAMLAICALGVAAHMLTSWWDTTYSQPKRYIAPLEQQIHSWLEMLPLFALVITCTLGWHVWRDSDASLTPRVQPLPDWARLGIPLLLAAGFAPILEEWWRGRRAQRARRSEWRHLRTPAALDADPKPLSAAERED